MSDSVAPTKEKIERCAFFIYVNEGCPEDHALDHWLEAETQLVATARHDAEVEHAAAVRADGAVQARATTAANT